MYRLLAGAILVLVTSATIAAAEPIEGTVVLAGGGKLTIADKEKNEHTFEVPLEARIQCDGKECRLEDLKKAYLVKVTTRIKEGGKKVASKIEAKTNK